MKLFNAAVLLLLGSAVNKVLASPASRQRYIAHFPADYDPFVTIADNENVQAETILDAKYKNQDWVFTAANLTLNEYESIRKELLAVGGVIERDQTVQLVDDLESITIDDPDLPDEEDSNVNNLYADATIDSANEYLSDVPQCDAYTDSVEYVVVDSLIYKDIPEFSNLKIDIGTNYANTPQPCLNHGSKVTSIIAGKTLGVIPEGNRSVYNIPVFDCTGNGKVFTIIAAFADAIKRGKENMALGRRTVVNFSGSGAKSDLLNRAATSVVDAGIPLTIAAGNSAINACDSASPASAAKVITVGATQPPGDVPAYFSNWGPTNGCVALYLPGEVTAINVLNNKGTLSFGTSFAAPIGAALIGMQLEVDPHATPAQALSRVMKLTNTIPTPAGSRFSANIAIMPTDKACSAERLFNTYSTVLTAPGQLLDWYNVANNQNFCVKFSARFTTNKGAILIGLRTDETDTSPVKISIGGKPNGTGKIYVDTIKIDNTTLAAKSIRNRIVNAKAQTNLMISQNGTSLLVSYFNSKKQPIALLQGDINAKSLQQVSFGNTGQGEVIYKNALAC